MSNTVPQTEAKDLLGQEQLGSVGKPVDEIVELIVVLSKQGLIAQKDVSLRADFDVEILKPTAALLHPGHTYTHVIENQIGYAQTLLGIVCVNGVLYQSQNEGGLGDGYNTALLPRKARPPVSSQKELGHLISPHQMAQFTYLRQIVAPPIVFEMKLTLGFSPRINSMFEAKERGAGIGRSQKQGSLIVDPLMPGLEGDRISLPCCEEIGPREVSLVRRP